MSKTTLFDSRIKKYAYREAAQLYGELGSSPAGLSPEQVERQREKYGSNCFGSRSSDTMLRRLRRAFINPFNVILFVLGSISLVTDGLLASDFSKNATTALIIFSMILISGGIRLVQELRAKNAAQQLDRLIHQRIRVFQPTNDLFIKIQHFFHNNLLLTDRTCLRFNSSAVSEPLLVMLCQGTP